MKRSINIFFSERDEKDFSLLLKNMISDIAFIDGCYWASAFPPIKPSIDECNDSSVYIWNRSIFNELSSVFHTDGIRYRGPQSAVVIQFLRCRTSEHGIRNGCISVGIDNSNNEQDLQMVCFVKLVWKLLNNYCVDGLSCVTGDDNTVINSKVPMFRVGPGAASWASEKHENYLTDFSKNRYKVIS